MEPRGWVEVGGSNYVPTQDGRQLCIVYLSGVGDGLRWLLPMSEAFARQYSLLASVSYDVPKGHGRLPPDLIKQCDLLICHHPGVPWTKANDYLSLLERFPPETRKIFVPQPRFHAFWPFHADDQSVAPLRAYQPFWPAYKDDSRNSVPDWPAGVDGKPLSYPFGDKYVLAKLDQGMSPEEVVAGYIALDIPSAVDLPELLSSSLSRIEAEEGPAHVKVGDFVAGRFASCKPFLTVSHPTNALFLYMANQILRLLNLPGISEEILERLQTLVRVEAPIHPSLGRYFDLPYVGESVRYLVDRHRSLTFSEYVRGYVRWITRNRDRALGHLDQSTQERTTTAALNP